mmetsp:Transcript_30308/g.92621  ORF Transcript_30308/g.92621 Transcript_30308/m.92621 type:complete len:94 (+) Transcript_30308:733-1014(+)
MRPERLPAWRSVYVSRTMGWLGDGRAPSSSDAHCLPEGFRKVTLVVLEDEEWLRQAGLPDTVYPSMRIHTVVCAPNFDWEIARECERTAHLHQ